MDTWKFLSDEYRPIVSGGELRITVRAELGPNASPERIANCVDALGKLLDLGERWAIVLAHEAAARSLVAEMMSDEDNPLL